MNLESPRVTTQKSQQEMFDFLTNVENYKQVMPESMEKFEVIASDTFLFTLKGMPQIALKITETREKDPTNLTPVRKLFRNFMRLEPHSFSVIS